MTGSPRDLNENSPIQIQQFSRKHKEKRVVRRKVPEHVVTDPNHPAYLKVLKPYITKAGKRDVDLRFKLAEPQHKKITISRVTEPMGRIIKHNDEEVHLQNGMWHAVQEDGLEFGIHDNDLEHYIDWE